ncbi:MAG: helicase-related protein, partial [Deltaproteobacteria bacterium]
TALTALRGEIAAGHQAYVVYPLVEESEKVDLAEATRGAERLRAALSGARLGLVHGRLPASERETVMGAFRDGKLDVLVATTVVEVGVDVPNATLMIVSGADRFGLSQLHQLRGRVGRGSIASRCLLLVEGRQSQAARERLRALCEIQDGFRLAEIDLRIRGPGEVLGTRQSGLPELAFADPVRQPELLARARALAFEQLERDPDGATEESKRITRALEGLFGGRRSLGSVG